MNKEDILPDGEYYCRYFMEIFVVEDGKHMLCENCEVRCPHSTNREEKDYLISKEDKEKKRI